jgi:hypothetical protein
MVGPTILATKKTLSKLVSYAWKLKDYLKNVETHRN